jgi:hypothetical protein
VLVHNFGRSLGEGCIADFKQQFRNVIFLSCNPSNISERLNLLRWLLSRGQLIKEQTEMAKQVWKFEPAQRWIRGTLNGETIVDSKHAMLMIESPGKERLPFGRRKINAFGLLSMAKQLGKPAKCKLIHYGRISVAIQPSAKEILN